LSAAGRRVKNPSSGRDSPEPTRSRLSFWRYGSTSNANHINDLRYQLEDFSNFDKVERSVATHSRNEKNRQSPMKQKKYTANCAMPVVGHMPALFINAIVQKTPAPVAIAFIHTCFWKIFMER
jgi:hypothetical protein